MESRHLADDKTQNRHRIQDSDKAGRPHSPLSPTRLGRRLSQCHAVGDMREPAARDERLPLLLEIPAAHKGFMAAPFIGPIEAADYLATGQIEEVLCGGENYDGARPCHYEWVKTLSEQCAAHAVTFNFIETGTIFYRNGKRYHIPSKRIQSQQAFRSGLSHYHDKPIFSLESPDTVLFDREKYRPHFRTHCSTCGSRLTCNGCSDCSNCDYR